MNKTLCKKTFEEKAIAIHGNKFNYSLVESYKKSDYITILCPTHGEYKQQVYRHLEGRECRKCRDEKQSVLKSIGTEEFIRRAKLIHFEKFDYSKVDYKNNHKNVIIICRKHGDFLQEPANHLSGKGCRRCAWAMDGITGTKLSQKRAEVYYLWNGIKQRCYNPKTKSYKRYGGRGINLSQEFHDYLEFEKYVKSLENYEFRKEKDLSLDRINNDGNYERGNLRWADRKTQGLNKSIVNKYGKVGIKQEPNGEWGFTIMISENGFCNIEEALTARNEYIKNHNLPHKIQ